MKILHCWDTAGVGACLAKYQRLLGHNSNVVKLGNWDGKGIDEYYATPTTYEQLNTPLYVAAKKRLHHLSYPLKRMLYRLWVSYPTLKLYWYVVLHKKEYQVIHIHSIWGAVLFTLFKPKLIEFHGDDVRRKPSMYSWLRRAPARLFLNLYSVRNKIYVSTPDLLDEVPNGVWIPNIADTEHFKPYPESRVAGSALYCSAWYETGVHAKQYAEANKLKLTVLDRKGGDWVDHRDFPKYLNQFEYYIDRKEIHSLSKTALEALACGLKVVDWQGNILTGLPKIHEPEYVAKLTIKIYTEILNKNV